MTYALEELVVELLKLPELLLESEPVLDEGPETVAPVEP